MSDKLIILSEKQFDKIIHELKNTQEAVDAIRQDLMDLDQYPTSELLKKLLLKNKDSVVGEVKAEVRDMVEPVKEIIEDIASHPSYPKKRGRLIPKFLIHPNISKWRVAIDELMSRKSKELKKLEKSHV